MFHKATRSYLIHYTNTGNFYTAHSFSNFFYLKVGCQVSVIQPLELVVQLEDDRTTQLIGKQYSLYVPQNSDYFCPLICKRCHRKKSETLATSKTGCTYICIQVKKNKYSTLTQFYHSYFLYSIEIRYN